LRGDVHDAVGINIESHLDLRNSSWSRWNPDKVELAQRPVVTSHRAFALQNVDFDRCLILRGRRKDLAFARGDCGVAFDQFGETPPQGSEPEAQRRASPQGHVFAFTTENTGLTRGAIRNDLTRIHPFVGFRAEKIADDLLDPWNSRTPADKHN